MSKQNFFFEMEGVQDYNIWLDTSYPQIRWLVFAKKEIASLIIR